MKLGSSFLLFIASSALNSVSFNCLRFGVSWFVMQETGSAVAFAALFSASSLAEVYSKPILAPLADYFDRLNVYRSCVAFSSLFTIALLFTVVAIPFSLSLSLLTILLISQSLITGLRDPASAGLIPSLVETKFLTEAQSLRSSVYSIVSLAAPMLSALLLAAGGIQAALSAAIFAAAASFFTTIGIRAQDTQSSSSNKPIRGYVKIWRAQLVDGVRAVLMTRAECRMAIVVAITNAALFPFFAVVLPLWVVKGLGSSAAMLAFIETAFGAGIFISSAWFTARLNRSIGRFNALALGNGFLGAGILLASFFTNPFILALCFMIGGVGFASFNINASTLRSAATPPAFRSRMVAGVAFLSSCLNPFATQTMGFFIEGTSITTGVIICGIVILISTMILLCNVDAKSLLTKSNEDILGAYTEMYPKAFVTTKQ